MTTYPLSEHEQQRRADCVIDFFSRIAIRPFSEAWSREKPQGGIMKRILIPALIALGREDRRAGTSSIERSRHDPGTADQRPG